MKLDHAPTAHRAAATAAIAPAAAVTAAAVVATAAAVEDGVTRIATGGPAATIANQGGNRARRRFATLLAHTLKKLEGKDELAPSASDSIFAFLFWSAPAERSGDGALDSPTDHLY
jgi:hypothetical protein